MRNPSSLKQEFLKNWVMGIQVCRASKKNMNIMERKKAIKLSADLALASARNSSSCSWSHALIANASKDIDKKILVDHILGYSHESKSGPESKKIMKTSTVLSLRSKNILKKSRCVRSRVKKIGATSIAKRLVKKRTQVLKRLVPGGESMDDNCLIEETLDYIVSLRAQVDVMRRLAKASEHLNCK